MSTPKKGISELWCPSVLGLKFYIKSHQRVKVTWHSPKTLQVVDTRTSHFCADLRTTCSFDKRIKKPDLMISLWEKWRKNTMTGVQCPVMSTESEDGYKFLAKKHFMTGWPSLWERPNFRSTTFTFFSSWSSFHRHLQETLTSIFSAHLLLFLTSCMFSASSNQIWLDFQSSMNFASFHVIEFMVSVIQSLSGTQQQRVTVSLWRDIWVKKQRYVTLQILRG